MYLLESSTDSSAKENISDILGVTPNVKSEDWCLKDDECLGPGTDDDDSEEESSDLKTPISDFLDLLDGKYEKLAHIGV